MIILFIFCCPPIVVHIEDLVIFDRVVLLRLPDHFCNGNVFHKDSMGLPWVSHRSPIGLLGQPGVSSAPGSFAGRASGRGLIAPGTTHVGSTEVQLGQWPSQGRPKGTEGNRPDRARQGRTGPDRVVKSELIVPRGSKQTFSVEQEYVHYVHKEILAEDCGKTRR